MSLYKKKTKIGANNVSDSKEVLKSRLVSNRYYNKAFVVEIKTS